MCLEYHIFRHPGPTFILVEVPLRALLRGTDNGECMKMAVGHQEFSTSFARTINHAAEDELAEDLLQQVMATTLEEELSLPCLDDVADYFSLAEEEAEFQDLLQEVKPKTSPIELKQLPSGLHYVFLNSNRETLVFISDKLSNDETQRLVATLEKYRSVIGYSLKDLKGITPSLCTHHIPTEQERKPIHEHQRQLNNAMREVVKKEVLKQLKVGVIYHVSDSEWVSLVQVGSKKVGMTIIHNGKNELIP
jgi:cobalamin biosynthesis Mg chelatase CobN